MESESRELLTDVGEYFLHVYLEGLLNEGSSREVGDDCAVIPLQEDDALLVNVDRLASNVEEYNRARLCVAQTLSDIICMGGSPTYFLVALTLPRDTTLDSFVGMMASLKEELNLYGARIIGGDTKEGSTFHMVGIGLGNAKRSELVRRVGVTAGMKLAVTMTSGRLWGGRWGNALIRSLDIQVQPELVAWCRSEDEVIRLPYAESRAAISTGKVRAGIDLSDGIGGGLRILGRESAVGFDLSMSEFRCLVDPRLEPLAEVLDLPVEGFAFSPGFNWENLYAVEEEDYSLVAATVKATGGLLLPVGVASSDPGIRIDGRELPLDALPADQKFAKEYAWEERFDAWRSSTASLFA